MVAEALAHFNDTVLCTTPLRLHKIHSRWDDRPENERLEEFTAYEYVFYNASAVAYCSKAGYSIYLYNFRIAGRYPGLESVRIFCKDLVLIVQGLVDIITTEYGEMVKDPEYGPPHSPFLDREHWALNLEESFWALGLSYWSEDLTWGAYVGYERNGCRTAAEDNVILTDSSWAEGF
ncbi:hypothetical protein ABW19_dt0207283 [Dactylella cylindrospora]|nr:hypothetical protein ABW19_dt0207283 [Dactylella cylindrospora]